MQEKRVGFCFKGQLADFLPAASANRWLTYSYQGKPALKDAIEALGVPHPEVALILVNGTPAGLTDPLLPETRITVYPLHHPDLTMADNCLIPPFPETVRFVLDVHLGKLAKSLRILGFDTLYQNNYTDAAIARIAAEEKRMVLTRDVGLLKHKAITWGYWLRSQQSEEQLYEVVRYFGLQGRFQPLSRCLSCNYSLLEVPMETVLEKLPPKTRLYFQEFHACPDCGRVYWKGSHYDRMQEFIHKVQKQI